MLHLGIAASLLLASLFALSVRQASGEEAQGTWLLPWEGGRQFYALQGQNQGSHLGFSSQYAYDFVMAPGNGTSFTVVAVRSGRVLRVEEGYGPSNDCDPAAYGRSNFLVVDHGDSTGAYYSHLAQGSVLPQVGQWVNQGQALALSDRTGYVCGIAHLHYSAIDIRSYASIDRPFADADVQRHGGKPQTGQWYTSDNYAGPVYRTYLPMAFHAGP